MFVFLGSPHITVIGCKINRVVFFKCIASLVSALPHSASAQSVERCSSLPQSPLQSVFLDTPCMSHLSLSVVCVSLDSIYKPWCLSLGYFCCSSSLSPHCTMPILCWAVCSAYFIHETVRDTCTSPQLHPHSRHSSLRFGILFLFQPHPSLPLRPRPQASCLIYLPLRASAAPLWLPSIGAIHPSGGNLKFSPVFLLFSHGCLISQWPGLATRVLLFSSWAALLNF